MYGLKPEDIQHLVYLKGGEVEQVCVGKFDLQFHLHPRGNISVWSRCELIAPSGDTTDTWEDGKRSERFLFCELLGATVDDVAIDNDRTFRLRFADGRQLIITDTSEQYESFSVDNLFV